jgi:hypothetical protein
VKVRVFGFIDWLQAGSVFVTQVLGSTPLRVLRRLWQQCHEGELPTFPVKNNVGVYQCTCRGERA